MKQPIALFGEAEKGNRETCFSVGSLTQLNAQLGHPPQDSRGIFFAIQFLLYEYDIVYFRVKEEGFSTKDYFRGFKLLLNDKQACRLGAICLPGVGDTQIMQAVTSICQFHQCLLIITEEDLYDYLTALQFS